MSYEREEDASQKRKACVRWHTVFDKKIQLRKNGKFKNGIGIHRLGQRQILDREGQRISLPYKGSYPVQKALNHDQGVEMPLIFNVIFRHTVNKGR